jgi:hypothetical protein
MDSSSDDEEDDDDDAKSHQSEGLFVNTFNCSKISNSKLFS